MADIDKILAERGKTHGAFSNQAECAQDLKKAFYDWAINNKNLTPYMREAVEMILHKLARAATGDPFVQDHWNDIAGYATLVSDRVGLRKLKTCTITGQAIHEEVKGSVPQIYSNS